MADTLSGKQVTALSGSSFLVLFFAAGMCLLPSSAQTSKAPDGRAAVIKCKPGQTGANCAAKDGAATPLPGSNSDPAPPPAAAAFPFPTEDSKRGGATATEPASPQNRLPEMPTGGVPDPPASSERPLHLPPGSAGSSSSSDDDVPMGVTGSSSSRSTDDDDVAPTTAAPGAPVKSAVLKDLGSRGDTSEARARLEQTRVADDLKVGSFYLKDGNAQGAYLRFKDAADRAPDDPEVRFSLAEAAGRLNKRDEAVLNYRECLKLDPGGDHDKASRKALSRLGVAVQ